MTHKSFLLKYPFILLLTIAVSITTAVEILKQRLPESPELIAGKAGEKLQQVEGHILSRLNQLALLSSDESIKESIFNDDDNSISTFCYLKDSLFAWSDNDILISQEEADSLPSGSIIKLRNGWYEVLKTTKADYHFYSLLLIKHEFAYQNKFLVNNFNPELQIPDGYNLILPSTGLGASAQPNGAIPLKNNQGQTLFCISPGEHGSNTSNFSLSAWLYMLVVLLLLGATYSFGRWLLKKSLTLTILFSLLALALRLMMIHFRMPDVLYATELFNPQLYASYAYMNSLGDFLINVLLVLCLLLVFTKKREDGKWKMRKWESGKVGNTHLLTFSPAHFLIFLLVIVILATILLSDLMQGIVFNSSINFNMSNVFDLNGYSFIGLLITALLMFIYFILVKTLVDFQRKGNYGNRVIMVIVAISLIILIASFTHLSISAIMFSGLLYICLYWFSRRQDGKGFPLSAFIAFLFITALYSSITIYIYSREKEQENRKLLAGKIEIEQDRVAEHLFEDVEDKIAEDTILQGYFKHRASTSYMVSERLHRRYFNGFWTKFETGSYCFDSLDHPFNKNLDSTSYQQFQGIINSVVKPTYAENLFFLTDAKGKSMYLARIPLFSRKREAGAHLLSPISHLPSPNIHLPSSDSQLIGTIFIELEPKLIQATQGFPELFISDKVAFNKDLANYSYSKYINNELVNQYGDFAYYFSASVFGKPGDEYSFINRDGYNHLLYRESKDNLIVVSKKQDTIYSLTTYFSYFFAFFSILLLLYIGLQNLVQSKLTISLSLKNRIQLSVITIVIFSVTMIGVGTIYYIIKKYDVNQSVRISTQLKSLLVTIENDLDEQIKPSAAADTFTDDIIFRLSRLSNNTSTDFNWYDDEGNLLFSSQPKIFDQGITSTLMNPIAYDKLTDKHQTQFVHPENIGKLNYIAAYQTLRNSQNQLLGYISLPFFEKENELNRDISIFLSALINIYVLMLLLTVLVTFFIASQITKPLLLIQEKLAKINLGRRNEFIQWNHKDEIGELVNEYNKKVEELALSADLLARSERESAWQEMAKQVAHEIKNPLTPMKLGVQHLLSAYNNNSPDKEELVKKISQTLIQQIDTLSNIANEFSNFAKMPQAKNEVVNISSILSDTINLFKESPDVTITFNDSMLAQSSPSFGGELGVGSREKAEVFADKDQLIRLFSNLLKNAIQSIPPEREGKIKITLSKEREAGSRKQEAGSQCDSSIFHLPSSASQLKNEGFFTVSVKDNGTGIADNQAEKIFTPNFTTKSGGMGLGLAIVKNIVENSGGKVWFETQIGVGTTFFVTLPALS